MKKKNEKTKHSHNQVHQLLNMGVKPFVAYAQYLDAKTENIVELYVWGCCPTTCIEYVNLLLQELEQGELIECFKKDSVVFLCTIHISEIHRFNPEILSNLFNLLQRIGDDLNDVGGIALSTTPDDFQQLVSYYFEDVDISELSYEIDSSMDEDGFMN